MNGSCHVFSLMLQIHRNAGCGVRNRSQSQGRSWSLTKTGAWLKRPVVIDVQIVPVPSIFRNQSILFGGKTVEGTTLPFLKHRQSRASGRQFAGILQAAKAHWANNPSVHVTKTGNQGKGDIDCWEGGRAFPSAILKEVKSAIAVLTTTMHCICRLYEMDFWDVVELHVDVSGKSINCTVDFVPVDHP